jgi:hypothetical protein
LVGSKYVGKHERRRLGQLLGEMLDDTSRAALDQLPVCDDTLSELTALRQDAKDFRWKQRAREREKRAKLEPLYRVAGVQPQIPSPKIQSRINP